MDASKLQLKIYTETDRPVPLDPFIAVFHAWIKNHKLDELMIDVANYAHVHRGPGVALIGHGSDYFMEQGDGRTGLLYSRKREAPAAGERVTDTFHRALKACAMLEEERTLQNAGLRFRTDEFLFRINDRLLAPNSDATFRAVRGGLETTCAKLFAGGAFVMAQVGTPKQLFSVRVTTSNKVDLKTLLGRLG